MNKLTPFHLAIPVDNLSKCRDFYNQILGCKEGRSSDHWVDFDFFDTSSLYIIKKNQLKNYMKIL